MEPMLLVFCQQTNGKVDFYCLFFTTAKSFFGFLQNSNKQDKCSGKKYYS